MQITNQTQPPRPPAPIDPRTLDFGKMFTPDFFVMDYRDGAWRDPRIEPLHAFTLHPACVVFHYAQTVFEGLKAYRQADGRVVLFRPELNARRFRASARRLAIPEIDDATFLEAVRALVENERHFLPEAPGCLYIRPTLIGVEPTLGVKSSDRFIFFVLTLPSGAYFKDAGAGPGAIDVLVSQSTVRAAPGGTGNVKAGGNYAVTLQITERAKSLKCGQVLFLDAGTRRQVEEMGGMNILFVRDGRLVTPPLTDTILPGVTRDSLLVLARESGLEVDETPITIDEVTAGIREGRITEAIACGTAAVTTAIRSFRFEDGSSVSLPAPVPGPVTARLYDTLVGIQYGRQPDTHGWVQEVCPAPTDAGARA